MPTAEPGRDLFFQKITDQRRTLTPKGQLLADYIVKHPRKAVFMTARELAAACGVSEATVVRFVSQIGCSGYGEFLQLLRDYVDTELNLLERLDIASASGAGSERFRRIVFEEMDNLRRLYEDLDPAAIEPVIEALHHRPAVYVVGSRLSYTLAYYMGWSLIKVRPDVRILKGSDSATIDWLTIAPPESLVVILATSRYPNDLLRVAKTVRRLGLFTVVITDSKLCPIIQFAHHVIVAPSHHIPFIGSPTTLSCLINYLVHELAGRIGEPLKTHQRKLERSYLENDILFNLDKVGRG